MRRSPIQGHGDPFSISSLKHFDEQTLAVLAALQQALRESNLAPDPVVRPFTHWGVVAAPRFLGRAMLGPSIARFHSEGAWGVSPHMIPYRSLHSISGTVSQYLKIHGPNFGVGGGPGGEAELLLAGVTMLDSMKLPGVWLLFSRIDPESHPDENGRPHADASCEAIAMAIVPLEHRAKIRLEFSIGTGDTPRLDFTTLASVLDNIPRQPGVTLSLGHFGRISFQQVSWQPQGPHCSFSPTRPLVTG
jgi:hypothetical protein